MTIAALTRATRAVRPRHHISPLLPPSLASTLRSPLPSARSSLISPTASRHIHTSDTHNLAKHAADPTHPPNMSMAQAQAHCNAWNHKLRRTSIFGRRKPVHETRVGARSGATAPAFPGAKVETPIPDYLQRVLNECAHDVSGHNADYIPELRDADSSRLSVCLSTSDGFVYTAGDADVPFSIQSISKAFVYALALEEWGLDYVLSRVGVEPSGEAFNELTLDSDTHNPLNPMINAGAIATHTLVGPQDLSADERFEQIRKGLSAFAGRELGVDEAVFKSELDTAYRNMAIACMLRNYNVIDTEPEDTVRAYTRQCAISVTCRDLALMAATLSNGGVQPVTGVRVVRREVVRQVLSVMMTCGMYNGAGQWVSSIGFPAKSGVAGGILGVLPGQAGIATFSPKLDSHGNSVRGVQICKRLSDDMGMHIMNAPEPARSVIRRDYILRAPPHMVNANGVVPTVAVIGVQGTINFTSAERVLRVINARSAQNNISVGGFVLDFRAVYSVDRVARRMFRELARRIVKAGMRFTLIDPEGLLGMETPADVQDGIGYRDMVTGGGAVDAGPGGRHRQNGTNGTGHRNSVSAITAKQVADDVASDERCVVDQIVLDLDTFAGWEKVQIPDDMRTLALPKQVNAEARE